MADSIIATMAVRVIKFENEALVLLSITSNEGAAFDFSGLFEPFDSFFDSGSVGIDIRDNYTVYALRHKDIEQGIQLGEKNTLSVFLSLYPDDPWILEIIFPDHPSVSVEQRKQYAEELMRLIKSR